MATRVTKQDTRTTQGNAPIKYNGKAKVTNSAFEMDKSGPSKMRHGTYIISSADDNIPLQQPTQKKEGKGNKFWDPSPHQRITLTKQQKEQG